MPDLDADTIRHALLTARAHGFRRVALKVGDATFRATLDEIDEEEAPIEEASTAEVAETLVDLTSPLVGYYRELPDPLVPGAKVKVGQLVGQIVALGLGNDVVAKTAGEVIEILVTAGEPVAYGQPLARLRSEA